MDADINDRTGPVPVERLWRQLDGRWVPTHACMLISCGAHVPPVDGSRTALEAQADVAATFFDAALSAAKARGFSRADQLVHEIQAAKAAGGEVTWPLLDLAEEAAAYAGLEGLQTAAQWLFAAAAVVPGEQGQRQQ